MGAATVPWIGTVRSSSEAPSTYVANRARELRRPRAAALRGRVVTTLHALVPLVLVGLWARSISGVNLRDMNDLGLVSVMPVASLVLVVALTVSFCVALVRGANSWVVLSHVLVLIVMLYGVTAFLEHEPRFQTVWRHVGVMDYIGRHGSVDPSIDAYFNWPGFFVLGDVLSNVAGLRSPLSMAAWAPLAFNLLFLPPLLVIFRSATRDPRLVWASVWVFFSANWVGQDYLAPQAAGFLLWLSIAAIVLAGFVQPGAARGTTLQRGGSVVVVTVLFAAIVTGHQLTPFAAFLTLAALAIFTRRVAPGLVWLLGILLAAWVVYMTTAYLSGNISTLTHPLGALGSNLDANVGRRLAGSPEHTLIGHIRVTVSAAIWALAVAGFLRHRGTWRTSAPLLVLTAAPFVLPVLQPYGGEILLRVYYFALPGAAFFVARFAFPTPANGRRWPVIACVAVIGCLLVVTFQYTRHGNERLDYFTRGDVATVRALYKVAPPDSVFFAGSYNLPWQYRNYTDYEYTTLADLRAWQRNPDAPGRVLAAIEAEAGDRPAFVIVTRSTRIAAEMLYGTSGSLSRFVAALRRSGAASEIYRERDGSIFRILNTRTS